MIDTALVLARFAEGERQALADALQIIHQLGVIPMQVEANSARVVEGFTNKDPAELAAEILQVQQTNRNLLTLHEWAGNFKRDVSNAQS